MITTRFHKKNLILVDCEVTNNWEFAEGLKASTKLEWEIRTLQANKNHGSFLNNIKRYFKYFIFPLFFVYNSNKYGIILSWQQFYGLILAFYLKFTLKKKLPKVVIMTFIYKSKKGVLGWLYFHFVRVCIKSRCIKKIFLYSNSEVQYYCDLFNVPSSLFSVVNLGIQDITQTYKKSTSSKYSENKFYLSVGRSNRDYDFLIRSWDSSRKLVIICDSLKKSRLNNNIIILNNCHDDDYLTLLSKCFAVIIPLDNEHISSGQLVLLQAKMFSKPVVITKNYSIQSYVLDEVDGIIINKNKDELNSAIDRLECNIKYYNKLKESAKNRFKEEYSLYAEGVEIGKVLNQLTS